VKLWIDMSSAEKADVVRPFAEAGMTARDIVISTAAPTRNSVVGLCRRHGITLHSGRKRDGGVVNPRKIAPIDHETEHKADVALALEAGISVDAAGQIRETEKARQLRIMKARRTRGPRDNIEIMDATGPVEKSLAGTKIWQIDEPNEFSVLFLESKAGDCRWPVGDWVGQTVDEKMVCGDVIQKGQTASYCKRHLARHRGQNAWAETISGRIAAVNSQIEEAKS